MGKIEKEGLDYDSEFMTKAASGGMLEVEMGKQVAARAATPEAKQFAQKMIADHTKANAELMALTAKKSITPPTTLGDEHAKVLKDVTEKKGVKMDREYMKEMIKGHQKDVKEFTDASIKASDPDGHDRLLLDFLYSGTSLETEALAAKNVPALQIHLDMATKM